MKVLIVSFDKTLTEELKEALSEHEVYTAKNSEEAIKVIPSNVEGIIYDAISGAISEEDINALYKKKFSQARYVILYDELFPVDKNNILPEKKILVPRELSPKEIANKLIEFPEEAVEHTQDEQVEDVESLVQELGTEDIEIEHTTLDLGTEEQAPQEEYVEREGDKEEPPEEAKVIPGKVLVVSFDQTLIDSIKANLGSGYSVSAVKTVKQAFEEGKDASVVVFDAISGMVAERGLMELSQDKVMSSKPYIILVDELFPINTDNVPLQDKEVLSRDSNPEEIAKLIREKAKMVTEAVSQESVTEEVEPVPQEELREEAPEFEVLEKAGPTVEEVTHTQVQEPSQEEEPIPALEALEKVIEEKSFETEPSYQDEPEKEPIQEEKVETKEPVAEEPLQVVTAAVSEEAIKEAVRKAVEESMQDIRELVMNIVRQEIEKVFEDMDVKELIKQVTYQALRERLEELIS